MLLGWILPILPKDALVVDEEAWNAYPYTRTLHTCPYIDKFRIEIETRYLDDLGDNNDVFNLSGSERKNISIGMYKLQQQIL